MTREEAIVQLNRVAQVANQNTIDAVEMAIEALEQQHCEDAISRKDMLAVFSQSHSLMQAWDGFEKLPSVTLKGKIGWIPISERVPKDRIGVLVYCPEHSNIFLAYLEHDEWYIFSPCHFDEPIDEPIVAWMPLPEPYKG